MSELPPVASRDSLHKIVCAAIHEGTCSDAQVPELADLILDTLFLQNPNKVFLYLAYLSKTKQIPNKSDAPPVDNKSKGMYR